MKLDKGVHVTVYDTHGDKYTAELLYWVHTDSTTGARFWWTQYVDVMGHYDVTLFDEADILKWNMPAKPNCTCGANAAKDPGHSTWCDVK